MGFIERIKKLSFGKWLKKVFGKSHLRVGIYGPPNAGKTTLANRIVRDWTGEVMGAVSEIPHETRRARVSSDIVINSDGSSLTLDIVDTPGIATKIDFHDFVENYGMTEEEGRRRAKEATEGVIEAIKWLDDVDGVLLVMDSGLDPFNQINITILGNLEARKLPVLIAANKIDRKGSSPATIKNAFPQHPVVPISALNGHNIEKLYRKMVKHFR
ncbi:MAG: Era-like GTP-binding protein [Thermoplasmata archaeon]